MDIFFSIYTFQQNSTIMLSICFIKKLNKQPPPNTHTHKNLRTNILFFYSFQFSFTNVIKKCISCFILYFLSLPKGLLFSLNLFIVFIQFSYHSVSSNYTSTFSFGILLAFRKTIPFNLTQQKVAYLDVCMFVLLP